MVLEPIYLDLSSSDDDDEDRNRAGSTALMYLSKVFHMDADDADDDVRIIDKPANHVVRRERSRVIRSALDDDECCILDADPGADAASPLDVVAPLDSDELVMTGEKGPVACRDFPHARYLCVHFPFKTTLHAKFCAQCHCYVCDSLAPCSLWGDGNNGNDHCHASEEPRWKTLRKVAKCGSVPSAPDPSGESRLVQSSILPHTVTQPPVGSGGATVKRDPLVIKLKGKGRGKPSQPPHLGVRSARSHRVLPLSAFPSHRNRPHTSTPPPSRSPEEVLPPHSHNPILEAPHHPPSSTLQPSQEIQPPHSSPVLEASHHPPGFNPQPSRRSQELQPPLSHPNPTLEAPHHPPGFTPHPFGRETEVQLPHSHYPVREAPHHRPGFNPQPSRRSQELEPPPSHPNPTLEAPHHPPGFTPHPFGREEEVQPPPPHHHHPPGFRAQPSQEVQPSDPNLELEAPHHPPVFTPQLSEGSQEVCRSPHQTSNSHNPRLQAPFHPHPPTPSGRSQEVQPPQLLPESGGADITGLRPPVVNDVFVLQPPEAAAAGPDDVSMDVSPASYPDSHRLAQNDASDIPIQGWEVDEFNVEEQVVTTSSFNDLFQQMAGDDYLWGHFPAW